jgi:hypothetical protein
MDHEADSSAKQGFLNTQSSAGAWRGALVVSRMDTPRLPALDIAHSSSSDRPRDQQMERTNQMQDAAETPPEHPRLVPLPAIARRRWPQDTTLHPSDLHNGGQALMIHEPLPILSQ